MRTYQKFKTIENHKCEDYLHQVTNTQHRITVTKLQLSNHKLLYKTPNKKLVCTYVCTYIRTYVSAYVSMHCLSVCMYVCVCACMYVCLYVCIHTYIQSLLKKNFCLFLLKLWIYEFHILEPRKCKEDHPSLRCNLKFLGGLSFCSCKNCHPHSIIFGYC